ncbi:MAG: hypothetical protein OXG02_10765 [Chloroflexi bacterium]|nr:hypothetical protein [Chloroflexota bacterium]
MWGLGQRIWRAFRRWERPIQWAGMLAFFLWVAAVAAVSLGPRELRAPAWIAAFGAVVAFQLLVMWSLRGMQTTPSLAWGAFRRGEYEQCRQLLAGLQAAGEANRDQRLLLAFCTKQLGRLQESEALARQLIAEDAEKSPAWRILGLVLMIEGRWEEATQALERASQSHADSLVELGLLRLLKNEREQARDHLQHALQLERCSASHAWLAKRILAEEDAPMRADDEYWREEAARFADSAYGHLLARLIAG